MAIHDKALLVSMTLGMPPQSKTLKGESEAIERIHRTEQNQATVVTKLFAKADVKGLQRVASQSRQWFKERTLPYGRSQGLVPVKKYFDFLQEAGELRLQFNMEKQAILDNIEDVLKRAQAANGTLFDAANYPSLAELNNSIYFSLECHPVPATNDYDKLADLSPEEIEFLKNEAVLNNQTKLEAAVKDLFGRLIRGLAHAADRLQDDDKGKMIFRDTLITNIHKAVEAAETLNIGDDETLKAMTDSVKEVFNGITADELRRDSKLRKATADKAAELASKMSELF